jgi:8-oxo-dGTP diphosphatase
MDAPKPKIGVGFGVMLLRNGNILLGKRHEDPAKADSEMHGEGTWTMPGGKLEFGESFEAGAVRELAEETGMQSSESSMKVITITNDILSDVHFVTIGLMCEAFDGEPMVMEPDEITEWRWFPLESLPEKVFFPSQEIITRYQKGQFYTR